jgi:hypothetical protein
VIKRDAQARKFTLFVIAKIIKRVDKRWVRSQLMILAPVENYHF